MVTQIANCDQVESIILVAENTVLCTHNHPRARAFPFSFAMGPFNGWTHSNHRLALFYKSIVYRSIVYLIRIASRQIFKNAKRFCRRGFYYFRQTSAPLRNSFPFPVQSKQTWELKKKRGRRAIPCGFHQSSSDRPP